MYSIFLESILICITNEVTSLDINKKAKIFSKTVKRSSYYKCVLFSLVIS